MTGSARSVGVGVVGLGRISGAHLQGYRDSPAASVVAVCDIRDDIAATVAAEFGAQPHSSLSSLLSDPRIDLVDIILPHNLHVSAVLASIRAGKNVLVEKPLAPTTSACLELLSSARAAGVTLAVAENTRFVRAYQAAKSLLEAGTLGKIRLVRSFIYGTEVSRLADPSSWKGRAAGTIGGAILDAGAHTFYLLPWLVGRPTWVRAYHDRFVPQSEVEDYAIVHGKLESGAAFSSEFTFTAEMPWGERLEIYGSDASLIIDQNHDPAAVVYRGLDDHAGLAVEGVEYSQEWKLGSIAAAVRDTVEAIATGRTPAVDNRDTAYAVMIAELSYLSARSGGSTVDVPRDLGGIEQDQTLS